jgi:DNA topoisomerase-3
VELVQQRKTTLVAAFRVSEKTSIYGTLLLRADGAVDIAPVGNTAKIGDRRIVGNCPVCGSSVVEGEKGYGCIRWREGCRFVIWKEMSERKIPLKMVRVLLRDGMTPFIQKFKRRGDGKRFDARLKVEENGKVGFDFTPTERAKREVDDKDEMAGDTNSEA